MPGKDDHHATGSRDHLRRAPVKHIGNVHRDAQAIDVASIGIAGSQNRPEKRPLVGVVALNEIPEVGIPGGMTGLQDVHEVLLGDLGAGHDHVADHPIGPAPVLLCQAQGFTESECLGPFERFANRKAFTDRATVCNRPAQNFGK